MKFLDIEWIEKHREMLNAEFNAPNRSNVELTEVYENCHGEKGKTIWISYKMVNGMLSSMVRGEREDDIPETTFRCFGDYSDYVLVAKEKLDPKTGILTGKFTLEGNFLKAMGMLGTYMRVTKCKRVPGMEY